MSLTTHHSSIKHKQKHGFVSAREKGTRDPEEEGSKTKRENEGKKKMETTRMNPCLHQGQALNVCTVYCMCQLVFF